MMDKGFLVNSRNILRGRYVEQPCLCFFCEYSFYLLPVHYSVLNITYCIFLYWALCHKPSYIILPWYFVLKHGYPCPHATSFLPIFTSFQVTFCSYGDMTFVDLKCRTLKIQWEHLQRFSFLLSCFHLF